MPINIKKTNLEDLEFLMFVLDELAEDLEKNGKDVIRLTVGNVQEPLHEDIIHAYVDAIQDKEKRNVVYPQGLPALRKRIAQWYADWGNPIDARNVVINTGTSPLFKDLFRLLLEEGDEVLLPYPYYSVYNVSAHLTPATIQFYTIRPDTLTIDIEEFKRKFNPEKTKLVVLNSPGNPYGNILTVEDYCEILDIVDGNAYILSDEIYRNLGFSGKVPSIFDVKTKSGNVIVSNAFSKGFRMYTARVGFFIIPDELVKTFRVLLQHTLLTASPSAQYACIEALNHPEEVEELCKLYKAKSEYTLEQLGPIKDITVTKAQGGFYLVIFCDNFMKKKGFTTSLELAKDILLKTGVAVVPGSDFGISTGLRLSFTHLRYNEGIDRLRDYFLEHLSKELDYLGHGSQGDSLLV